MIKDCETCEFGQTDHIYESCTKCQDDSSSGWVPLSKVNRHKNICLGLNELYARKNHDYGDSFHQTFVEEGMAMARIRLGDKFNRFNMTVLEMDIIDQILTGKIAHMLRSCAKTIRDETYCCSLCPYGADTDCETALEKDISELQNLIDNCAGIELEQLER